MNSRMSALTARLDTIDHLLISDPYSIDYLLDRMIFPGERMLLLVVSKKQEPLLFLNRLFHVPEDLGVRKVYYSDTDDQIGMLAEYLDPHACVGVDKNWPARFLLKLMAKLPEATFVNGSFCIDGLRMIKSPEEIAVMKEASRLNDLAMARMIDSFYEGVTENEMAAKLLTFYEELGASGYSFPPIVAYQANGADGHHGTDDTPLKAGDSIVIDMGCRYQGYCSDMTRTVFYKQCTPRQKEIYELVKKANLAAEAVIKPGVPLKDIDQAARDVITKAGYGPNFNHRTGHFIGREVHEYGDVSSAFDIPVAPGMIFSIEPGVYLEGEFGVRVEDLVLVTEDGCEVLNHYFKDLTIIA